LLRCWRCGGGRRRGMKDERGTRGEHCPEKWGGAGWQMRNFARVVKNECGFYFVIVVVYILFHSSTPPFTCLLYSTPPPPLLFHSSSTPPPPRQPLSILVPLLKSEPMITAAKKTNQDSR
jgi:hypothetical protein